MALWLVRAGRNGEQEDLALDEGLAVIGWRQVPDLHGIGSRDDYDRLPDEVQAELPLKRIWTLVPEE